MTQDQAQLIVNYFPIVKHFANGGQIEFIGHDCSGNEMLPQPVSTLVIESFELSY